MNIAEFFFVATQWPETRLSQSERNLDVFDFLEKSVVETELHNKGASQKV